MAANSSCLSDLFEREESGGGFYIGVIISLLSSTSTNFGANVQKFALNREATKPILKQRPMYVIPLWIAGFALFLSSQVGDAVALAFAPQSVVQPVGSISLLANMFFGWWLNGEPIGRWTPVAMLIIIGGVGSIVSFGPKETVDWNFEQIEDRWSSPEMTLYVLIVGGLTFSLLALLVHYDRRLERQRARLRAQERQLLKAATAASPGTTPPALVPSLRGSGAAEHLRVLETPPPPAHSAKPLPPLRPIDCLTARERRALTVLYPLTAAVVAGWTPLLMKQTLLLLQSAARGDAVHSSVAAWCVLLGTCLSGPIQLTCLAKGLRNVEAQLMVPAFASLFTICSILGAAAFFKVLLGCSLGGLAWLIAELPCALMSATTPPLPALSSRSSSAERHRSIPARAPRFPTPKELAAFCAARVALFILSVAGTTLGVLLLYAGRPPEKVGASLAERSTPSAGSSCSDGSIHSATSLCSASPSEVVSPTPPSYLASADLVNGVLDRREAVRRAKARLHRAQRKLSGLLSSERSFTPSPPPAEQLSAMEA